MPIRRAVADEHIRALVDAAPPLTAEQRARLAALLPAPQTYGSKRGKNSGRARSSLAPLPRTA